MNLHVSQFPPRQHKPRKKTMNSEEEGLGSSPALPVPRVIFCTSLLTSLCLSVLICKTVFYSPSQFHHPSCKWMEPTLQITFLGRWQIKGTPGIRSQTSGVKTLPRMVKEGSRQGKWHKKRTRRGTSQTFIINAKARSKANEALQCHVEWKINMGKNKWIHQAYYSHLYCKGKFIFSLNETQNTVISTPALLKPFFPVVQTLYLALNMCYLNGCFNHSLQVQAQRQTFWTWEPSQVPTA